MGTQESAYRHRYPNLIDAPATLFHVLTHRRYLEGALPVFLPDTPERFAMCCALLTEFEGWGKNIGQVGAEVPLWKPFTDEWATLSDLLARCSTPEGKLTKASYAADTKAYHILRCRLDFLRQHAVWKVHRQSSL